MSDSTQEQQAIEGELEAREQVVFVKSEEETDATTKPKSSTTTSKKPTTDTKKKRKKGKWKPTHPNSTMMCIEAIQSLKEGRGSSAQAIKKYILATYDTVRPDMVNYMVRTALSNGIQTGAFARPKGNESSGAHGRFKVGNIPDMPTKTCKPSIHKKASPNKKASKKELKNKRNDKKSKNTKKSKKKTASKKKKTKPSNKATLKVKASPKPKRAKKKD